MDLYGCGRRGANTRGVGRGPRDVTGLMWGSDRGHIDINLGILKKREKDYFLLFSDLNPR